MNSLPPGFLVRSRRSGVALLLVLLCLVLVSGLVIAFLTSARTDLTASTAYSSASNARLVADSALNLVIGQIQKSTANTGEAWISQPGLIRTFDVNGNPQMTYKLYSSDKLEVPGAFDPGNPNDPSGDFPPTGANGWRSLPNLFTDLNTPIKSGNYVNYPVIDASGLTASGVLDADGDGQADIEGFSVTDPNFLVATGTKEIPMPVKWLYQLKDGQFATATAGPGNAVTLKALDGSAVTAANPPVARIAFWTDDESSKININTASEGAYWDTPTANTWPTAAGTNAKAISSAYSPNIEKTLYEFDLASYQGAQKEFQRYSGHPATTSLSPVLFSQLFQAQPSKYASFGSIQNARTQLAEDVFELTPRVVGGTGSSKSGTVVGKLNNNTTLVPDTDRLYATVDDYFFKADRTSNPFGASAQEAAAFLSKSKFFLTANSRAPETTLFGTPRVASWPIPLDPAKRTAFDKAIAFCSTLNSSGAPQVFYTTRSNSLSATEDFTSRNLQVYSYLLGEMNRQVPGFGNLGTLGNKFGADAPQILTEIFDYVRILNLYDQSAGAEPYTLGSFQDPLGNPNSSNPGNQVARNGRGLVVPLQHPTNGTKGFGRFPTISGMILAVVSYQDANEKAEQAKFDAGNGYDSTNYYKTGQGGIFYQKQTSVQVVLFPDFFAPASGYTAMFHNFRVEFSGLKSLLVNGSPIFPSDTYTSFSVGLDGNGFDQKFGGSMGILPFVRSDMKSGPPVGFAQLPGNVVKNVAPKSITIGGGPIHVKMQAPYDSSLGPIQTIQEFDFDFPVQTVPMPSQHAYWKGGLVSQTNPYDVNPDGQRGAPWGTVKDTSDSWRSLVPTKNNCAGDFRLVAGLYDPSKYFEKHADYTDPTNRVAHSIGGPDVGGESVYSGTTYGDLVPGIPNTDYSPINRPAVPKGTSAANSSGGEPDWDTGMGLIQDGPYINKADDGLDYWHASDQCPPYIGTRFALQDTSPITAPRFSPNRQMPSPVMFGSLSTGVKRSLPWQTLLFRPAKSYLPGGVNHPGGTSSGPPDYLLLDLFWMPVVEPYPISEPFSTAGKINLNYQIAPFTYIERKTGIYGLLKSLRMPALNPNKPTAGGKKFVNNYKSAWDFTRDPNTGGDVSIRRKIDIPGTLRLFDDRFGSNKPFLSGSEICSIPLIPADSTDPADVNAGVSSSDSVATIENKLRTFWRAHTLTGDNLLERPYAHIYPRVTTKSNTFTVHVYVQTLQKTKGQPADQFDSAKDSITGEFRGSYIIERFLDPNKQTFDESNANSILGPYKCRVISSKQISM